MEKTLNAVLRLVRSALCCEPAVLPEPLDLEQVAQLAVLHQIEALVYDGAIRSGISKQEPAMKQLFQAYCRAAVRSDLQLENLNTLYRSFDAAKIDYLPLKGCIMKGLYPKAELRAMNDADILIRVEQYDAIKPLLEKLEYRFLAESDCELKWRTKGLYLELHKRLIPSFVKDFYAYFGDGWQLAVPAQGSRYEMSREDEFLFLFTHFARHYREGGVGIRHMADIWYYRLKTPELKSGVVEDVLKKMSLDTFYHNILKTLENWFEGGEQTQITEKITEYIANSGSFGTHETKVLADGLRKGGRRKNVCRLLFPPLDDMQYSYPVLRKCPALLPAMWIYRGGRLALFGRDRIKRQQERLGTMETEKMDAFEKSLRDVGLGLEFEVD
ncbi:MAG: nucleotidyltransferase family protein [Oscillospiraceae bacterium]|nr:nucleotidyltransferase family protein [Oscillospiraceae bacterium]